MSDTILTTEWGRLPRADLAWVRCPVCKVRHRARLTPDHSRLELPAHGRTPDLECPGGGKWYESPPPVLYCIERS